MARMHYALCKFSDGSNSNSVMLYRFSDKKMRDLYVSQSKYRVAITRDIARLVFPNLRGRESNPSFWVDIDMKLYSTGERWTMRHDAKSQYFYDNEAGMVAARYWTVLPDHCPDIADFKTRMRHDWELKKFERDHLIISHLD